LSREALHFDIKILKTEIFLKNFEVLVPQTSVTSMAPKLRNFFKNIGF